MQNRHDTDAGSAGQRLQVKICGLTRPDEALQCVQHGAEAIGMVFYPPSPRHVDDRQAIAICRELPPEICSVGVFVNEGFIFIMKKVERCGLKAVQLHGRERPELVQRLRQEGLIVLKTLFADSHPSLADGSRYPASAFLVECAPGTLPGGNAMQWDWSKSRELPAEVPRIIAGGLSPQNIHRAVVESHPDAVDVSSGVEKSPGRKDTSRVKAFMEAVFESTLDRVTRRIF